MFEVTVEMRRTKTSGEFSWHKRSYNCSHTAFVWAAGCNHAGNFAKVLLHSMASWHCCIIDVDGHLPVWVMWAFHGNSGTFAVMPGLTDNIAAVGLLAVALE
jgi:hypothetical protein